MDLKAKGRNNEGLSRRRRKGTEQRRSQQRNETPTATTTHTPPKTSQTLVKRPFFTTSASQGRAPRDAPTRQGDGGGPPESLRRGHFQARQRHWALRRHRLWWIGTKGAISRPAPESDGYVHVRVLRSGYLFHGLVCTVVVSF